jgi:hypothetical protein
MGRRERRGFFRPSIIRPFCGRQIGRKFDPDPPAFRLGSPRGLVRGGSKSRKEGEFENGLYPVA